MPEYKDRSNMPGPARAISSFFHMLRLNKEMTNELKDELHNLIKIHGFNDGFQKFLFAYDVQKNKEKEQKEILTYRYANGILPKPQKEKQIVEDGYKPSIKEIKKLKVKHREERFGTNLTLYERTKGWHIVLIESPNLEKPKVFLSSEERSGQVMQKAIAFYTTLYKQSDKKETYQDKRKKIESDTIVEKFKRSMSREDKSNDDLNDPFKRH